MEQVCGKNQGMKEEVERYLRVFYEADFEEKKNQQHKKQFKYWVKQFCSYKRRKQDEECSQHIVRKQYEANYLNQPEYNFIVNYNSQSLVNREISFEKFEKLQSQFILYHCSLLNEQDKLALLEQYKDSFIKDDFILKKEYYFLSDIGQSQLLEVSQLDLFDTTFQERLIEKAKPSREVAMSLIVQHLLHANGSRQIWQHLYDLLQAGPLEGFQQEFEYIVKHHLIKRSLIQLRTSSHLEEVKIKLLLLKRFQPHVYDEIIKIIHRS